MKVKCCPQVKSTPSYRIPGTVFRATLRGQLTPAVYLTTQYGGAVYFANLATGMEECPSTPFVNIIIFPNAKVVCKP